MAEVKWIKITTDIFDDEKILLIESLPDPYAIITVWFKLLCLAGKQNNNGVFLMGRIAYNEKMLATIFRMNEATVTMALRTFEEFGMVEIIDGVITIPNWNKHQSLDAYQKRKERDRLYQANKRAEQRALIEKSADASADASPDIGTVEEDKEEDIEVDIDKESKEKVTCKQVVALYKQICVSFPSIRSLTEARRKAIKARLNTYTLDDFKKLFEMAEASAFLKGANDRNWTATFDWLIKDANMAKVLEGNFVDKPGRYTRKETKPNWMQPSGVLGEAELYGIQRAVEAKAEEDPAVMAQAEALKKQMQEKYGKAGNGA